MSFKVRRQREQLQKKVQRGFRGFPVATIAHYGPTDRRASKVVVGIVETEGAEPEPMRKWFSDTVDVRQDPDIIEAITHFLKENAVKSVLGVDRIIGCPHEEGIDYPQGEWCPECPFWEKRDRFSGKKLE